MKLNYTWRSLMRASGRGLRACAMLFAGSLAVAAFAQTVNTYTFSQVSGTYTPISGGVVYGTTTSDDQRFVDPAVPAGGTTTTGVGLPIGFNFFYAGQTFDRLAINNNGWISLGQSALSPAVNNASTSAYTPLASTTATTPTYLRSRIAAVGRDLQAQTGSTIRLETIGSAPNRICVVQWTNYKRFSTAGTGDNLNFQILLYETSGVVEVQFGSMVFGTSATATSTAHLGLGGSAATEFNNRKCFATASPFDWNNTVAGTTNADGMQLPWTSATVVVPVSGTTYRWSPPTCLPPTAVAAVGVSTNSGTITFTPPTAGGTPASYVVEYGLAPFTTPGTGATAGAGGTVVTGAGSGIVLSGLNPASTYVVYVRSFCGGSDYSANSSAVLFNTACSSQSVPYTENFNGAIVPEPPPCITKFHSVGAGWVSVAASAPFTGNMFHRVGTAAAADDWFLTRGLNLTIGQSYRLRFKYGNTSTTTAANLYVSYGNSPSPGSMTNPLLSFATINSGSTVANQAQVDFIPLATGTYYIGFYTSYTGTATNIRVDDIEVTVTPLCESPTTITTSNITASSADVGFTCVSCVGSYIVEYGVSPFSTPGTGATAGPGGTVVTGGSSPITISGLTPNTSYTVFVRENCGINGYSSNSTSASFTTPCAAFSVPWSDSFENNTTNDAAPLPCFSKEIITGSATTTWRQRVSSITGSGTVSARTGTDFMAHTWSANSWLFSPGMNVTAGTSYDFSFWYAHTAAVTGYTLTVGVGTTASSAGMTTTLATITNPVNQSWLQGNYTWVAPTTGVYYFGVQANAPTSTPWYMCTDDWSLITTPTCPIPTLLSTTGTTNNSTQASWTCTGCTGTYILEYGAPGFTPGTGATPGVGGTVVTAGSSPATITGLTGNTAYQVYVRQDCGGGNYSPGNAGPASFTTLCDPVVAPYTQNFDGGIAPNYGPPACWVLDPVLNTTTSWMFANGTGTPTTDPDYNAENITDHTTGSGFFAWWDGSYTAPTSRYMYSPMVDMTALTNRYVSLWFYANNTTDVARNTITVDVWDGAAWLNLITFNSNVSAWTELAAVVPGSVPASTNFRIGGTVGTLGGSAFYFDMLVDDFKVVEAPTCFAPTGLAAANVTNNTADVNFTAPGSGTPIGYVIEYGAPGFIPGTTGTAGAGTVVTSASSPAGLSGLTQNTAYQVYVRTDCGAGDYSANAGPISFTTLCNPFVAPYSENFDSGVAPNYGPPACYGLDPVMNTTTSWRFANGQGTPATDPDYGAETIGDHTTGSGFYAWWDGSYTTPTDRYMYTNLIDMSALTTPYVTIWCFANNVNDAAVNRLNVDVWNGTAWQNVITYSGNDPAWKQLNGAVPSGVPSTTYFRIAGQVGPANGGSNFYQDLLVDDFSVTEAPTCLTPVSVSTGAVTGTTAQVSWNCVGCTGTYIIEYGPTGFTPGTGGTAGVGGTIATAASSPATVTGLAPLTSYQVYVRQDCGAGLYSANSTFAGFTTACPGTQCDYTFRLMDLWGDGWNGGVLQVKQNGTVVQNLTYTSGCSVDVPVSICNGANVELLMTNLGSFSDELVFRLFDAQGSEVYSFKGTSTSTNCPATMAVTSPNGVPALNTVFYSFVATCPTCTRPGAVAASNITQNTAEVAWSCLGCTGSYIIEYGPAGFTPGTGAGAGGGTVVTAASSPVTITGLAASTPYHVYVRQDCGGGDISSNSLVSSFTTVCGSFPVPWADSFESNTTDNANPLPCFSREIITGTATSTWRQRVTPISGSGTVGARTGTDFMAHTWSANSWLFSPGIDLTAGTSYDFSFWYAHTATTAGYTINAAVGTTASAAGMTTALGTIPNPGNQAYQEGRYTFVAPATGTYYFGVQAVCPTAAPWYLTTDDWSVNVTPPCAAPTSLASTGVSATTADISWNCVGCAGSFILEYGPAATFTTPGVDATPGVGGTVLTGLAASPYTLTGLATETQYRYFVRQDCGGGTYSSNAGPGVFTTSFDCALSPTITCGQQVTTTFSGTGIWNFAGTFPNNSCGFTTSGQERVFQFNAPAPGQYSIVMGGGTAGYVDWLWKPASGGCSNTGWTCIDDITSTTSTTNFTLPAAGLYYLIGDPEGTTSLTKIFTITCPATNISCSAADPILCGEVKSGNTAGGINTLPTSACAFNGAADVGGVNWWVFTALTDETLTASTCGLAAFNTRISVFSTTTDCNALVCHAQSDDVPGCASSTSEVEFPVTTGTTYYIAVHGPASGPFQLGLTCNPSCTTAPNDQCANADPLAFALIGSSTPTVGDNSCAYGDGITTCSAAGNVQGVWYTFNTGAYTRFRLTLEDVDLNATYTSSHVSYALFSGACTGNSANGQVACVANGPGTSNLPVLNTNSTYRLLVYNTGGVGTEGTFGINLEAYAANDAQITSVLSPTGSTCGSQFTPVAIIKNNGTSTLTSATISVDIDGGPVAAVYTWTGSLAFGQQTPVVLPIVSTSPGLHTLNVYTSQPNGVADEVPTNDAASSSYDAAGETVKLEIKTDNFGAQTTWVIEDLIGFTVASGGPYPSNTVIPETRCLPTTFGNCWTLRILDSFGDGMCCANGNGYWRIMDQFNNTLLQDDGIFTTQSPAAGANPTYVGHEFCIPIGSTRIEAGECNVYTNVLSSKVYTTAVPGNLGGYQFEFTDPDNAYRRRITVTNRYVKFSQLQSSPLTPGTKYFCRSKADPAGDGFSNDNWGPGCDMGLDPVAVPGCTQLIDDTDLPTHSCNTTRSFGYSDKIWAQPVLGATQYRFKFEGLIDPDGATGPLTPVGGTRVITQTSYVRVLNWATYTLVDGETYTVTVEVQVSGQWSGYCGAACGLTISNPAFAGNNLNATLVNSTQGVELYPNPVRDGNVNLSITGLTGAEGEVLVDVYDVFGKRVFTRSIGTEGATELRTVLNLGNSLASGAYMVHITMGNRRSVQRLSIQ